MNKKQKQIIVSDGQSATKSAFDKNMKVNDMFHLPQRFAGLNKLLSVYQRPDYGIY